MRTQKLESLDYILKRRTKTAICATMVAAAFGIMLVAQSIAFNSLREKLADETANADYLAAQLEKTGAQLAERVRLTKPFVKLADDLLTDCLADGRPMCRVWLVKDRGLVVETKL